MEKDIYDKINELTPDQKRVYAEKLVGILECKGDCFFYGAKDPVNMPQRDIEIVKINLYQEMFEPEKYKTY